ncbi:MAG TPA: hypothetical protein VHC45_04445 [Gaiellaceae bacterium]|jgi:hypothetical protein|nr:hypothetical protein [Gaiellaceae bacterium]
MSALAVQGEAREVVLAEAQAVHAMAVDEGMRQQLAELVAAADGGEIGESELALAESVLELGLQSGRIRAVYGPGGEQAALRTLRRLPRGRDRVESTNEVSAALRTLAGTTLENVTLAAVAPGAFTLTIDAGGVSASVRLDASGARLTSLGT